jgi:[ribosomal protein S18]-alanine N-acetyltransferase
MTSGAGHLAYIVRKMAWEDIEQVREIDTTCFPTMLPPTNYRTEMINPMAHYLVAFEKAEGSAANDHSPFILGFVGIWFMAGEAHIINIAVRPSHRHQGAGEFLLLRAIEVAQELNASMVTLEVRVSNWTAQRLYAKYGFTERGVRKAYYTDDREDAVIMTVDNPRDSAFQAQVDRLKQGYEAKWGVPAQSATPARTRPAAPALRGQGGLKGFLAGIGRRLSA